MFVTRLLRYVEESALARIMRIQNENYQKIKQLDKQLIKNNNQIQTVTKKNLIVNIKKKVPIRDKKDTKDKK